jgi:hypothetical protein
LPSCEAASGCRCRPLLSNWSRVLQMKNANDSHDTSLTIPVEIVHGRLRRKAKRLGWSFKKYKARSQRNPRAGRYCISKQRDGTIVGSSDAINLGGGRTIARGQNTVCAKVLSCFKAGCGSFTRRVGGSSGFQGRLFAGIRFPLAASCVASKVEPTKQSRGSVLRTC